jgi:ankyrin repeat protein
MESKLNQAIEGWKSSEKRLLEVVRFLAFLKGADITSCNKWAVQLASKNGHLKVVQWLVSQGANIRACNNLPLHLASKNGHYEVVKYLVSQGAPTTYISEKARHYLSFCKKMEEKKRIRAQKKIYFWWIPICYDIARPCGQRMAERNLALYHSM